MPVIKYERILKFVKRLSERYPEIPTGLLHQYIAMEFGVSPQTRRNIHQTLSEFDLIRLKNGTADVWVFNKEKIEKDIKELGVNL